MPFNDDLNLTSSGGFKDDLNLVPAKKRSSGAGGSFSPSFYDKAIEFVTAGHIPAVPYQSEELTKEGKLSKMFPEEGGKVGFFEDPVTALSFGVGAGTMAAKPLYGKLLTAGREAVGWMTGGASEIPSLGVKGVKGIAKSIEVKNLEKLGAKRVGKPFAETALKYVPEEDSLVGQVIKTTSEALPKETQFVDDLNLVTKEKPIQDIKPQVGDTQPQLGTIPDITWQSEVKPTTSQKVKGGTVWTEDSDTFLIIRAAENELVKRRIVSEEDIPKLTHEILINFDKTRNKTMPGENTGEKFGVGASFGEFHAKFLQSILKKDQPKLGGEVAKQPWDMTRDELYKIYEGSSSKELASEREILGKEYDAWNKAQRQLNSGNDAIVDKAYKDIERIESKLSQNDKNTLYGIGDESTLTKEDYRTILDQVDYIDDSSPNKLGESLRYAISKVSPKMDKSSLTVEQQGALASIKHGFEIAKSKGWDTKEISDVALKEASKRYGEDARFMLRDYMKPEAGQLPQAVKDVSILLKSEFGVEVLGGIEKPRGLTGKDIDTVLKVDDLSKLEGKRLSSSQLNISGKPIDVFVTDGKRVLVGEQVSPQQIIFTEKPSGLKKKLTISKETLNAIDNQAKAKGVKAEALEPLAGEARKYGSAEEFVESIEHDVGGIGKNKDYTPTKRMVETEVNDTPLTNFGFKPDDKVTIYRGVDNAIQKDIVAGDYIATSPELAGSYTGGKVISKEVPASSVRFSSGDGITANNFKNGFNKAHIEGVYNPNPLISKSQLTDIYNQAKAEGGKVGEGLSKLAEEQSKVNQAGNIIIDLGKRDTKPAYTFPKENEFPYQSAKGIKSEGIIQRLKSIATEVGHKFSRTYEHLPNTGENSQLIFDLKRLEKQKEVVADRTTRSLGEVLSGLNKEDYNLFNRKIILDDLASDVNRGLYQGDKKLPFNFTPESLIQEKSKLDALISTNPKVIEALGKRDAFWEQQIKPEYIEALSPYKIGVEDMFKENYYRHQVLDYVSENGIFGTGKRLKTPNKGYMRGRTGASNLYNTDFIEAEHNIMAQMLHDAETAKTLTKIKDMEDIFQVVRNKAKVNGIENWHDAIPEGYTVWQPKEGSVFHPVLTIEERTAQKILEGNIDSILGDEGKLFKEALAVGGKRKEWVVRQEVADTLNNLVRERTKGIISSIDLSVLTAWKKWQLVSPRRYFKYNMRNLTGDAEAVFLGNMSGFKKAPQAVKELGETFFGKKEMTPDMDAWFERGGMGSTLQAQEMDALKKTWMFSRLHEGADLNIWNKYWRVARLTTDFRESILRYANFLDFKEQIIKNGGGPLNYAASKPEMIDALKDVNDKAFALSNDLLGAYDRVSVAGQTLRERLIPFWSWQEVNFKRYIQLMKNTSNNTELAAKIGVKLGATTARTAIKIGGFAIKAAAFSSALAVYNHTFFPEEEKQLSPDLRATPHIITGRDKQGNIQYFSRMGTLDDFISWFGLDTAPKLITEYLNGKKTLKEMLSDQAKEAYKGPINKVVQGGEPFLKLAGEIAFRRSSFPDIFKAGTIRDRWLHLARSFGLENEYIAMAGKPSKGYGESLKGLFVYKIDPGESAYRQVYDMKSDFLKKLGRTSEGFWLTPTGDTLYNMKLALKYDDKKAFTKYFTEYITIAQQQGKNSTQIKQGLKTAIQSMNPLYGMDDKTKRAFVASLNKDDQDTLVEAIQFYNKVLSPNKEGD